MQLMSLVMVAVVACQIGVLIAPGPFASQARFRSCLTLGLVGWSIVKLRFVKEECRCRNPSAKT